MKNYGMKNAMTSRYAENHGAKGMHGLLACRCILLFLFFMLSFFLSSCHHHDDEPDPTEQTILFYFPWSGNDTESGGGRNLYNIFLTNIAELEQAITTRQTMANARLLICLGTHRDKANLYEVKLLTTKKKTTAKRELLTSYSDIDFTNEETIRRIITDVKSYAPAEHYGLMIGCHGMGWIPRDSGANYSKVKHRYFGGVVPKFQTDIITLVRAIENSGTHMDFILFDDCYMANVEVAYDLRSVTDYLVASTSEIMERGLPYDQLWSHLSPKPDFAQVVQKYFDFYTTYTYPYGTLSAIDCREVEAMASLMREANQNHTLDESEIAQLQTLDGYSPVIFFDMGDYIDHLCADDTSLRASLRAQLNRLVPHAVATQSIYSMLIGGTIPLKTFSGITISDPSLHPTAEGKMKTTWWNVTH